MIDPDNPTREELEELAALCTILVAAFLEGRLTIQRLGEIRELAALGYALGEPMFSRDAEPPAWIGRARERVHGRGPQAWTL